MRWMGLATLRIETAGGSSSGADDATKSVSSRWFVPVMPEASVKTLIESLRPGLGWNEDQFDWQSISPRAIYRLLRLSIVYSILTGIAGLVLSIQWGWLIGLVALPFHFYGFQKKPFAKIRSSQRCSRLPKRRLNHKTSLTFFEKIQTVRVDETPFDRRWEMASLCIDTAAAGPANHRIHIDYLPSEFAKNEFKRIINQASGQTPVFS